MHPTPTINPFHPIISVEEEKSIILQTDVTSHFLLFLPIKDLINIALANNALYDLIKSDVFFNFFKERNIEFLPDALNDSREDKNDKFESIKNLINIIPSILKKKPKQTPLSEIIKKVILKNLSNVQNVMIEEKIITAKDCVQLSIEFKEKVINGYGNFDENLNGKITIISKKCLKHFEDIICLNDEKDTRLSSNFYAHENYSWQKVGWNDFFHFISMSDTLFFPYFGSLPCNPTYYQTLGRGNITRPNEKVILMKFLNDISGKYEDISKNLIMHYNHLERLQNITDETECSILGKPPQIAFERIFIYADKRKEIAFDYTINILLKPEIFDVREIYIYQSFTSFNITDRKIYFTHQCEKALQSNGNKFKEIENDYYLEYEIFLKNRNVKVYSIFDDIDYPTMPTIFKIFKKCKEDYSKFKDC